MNFELKKMLKEAFDAPKPLEKTEFLNTLRKREISMPELIVRQISYIRKSVWIIALVFLIAAVYGIYLANEHTLVILESIVPLSASLAIMEINRSDTFGMKEFETATRFSFKSVYHARMIVIGVLYLLVMITTAPFLSFRFELNLSVTVLRLIILYLLVSIACLKLERSERGRENPYMSLALSIAVSLGVVMLNSYKMTIINFYIQRWGILIAGVLAVVLEFENRKTINMKEDYKW